MNEPVQLTTLVNIIENQSFRIDILEKKNLELANHVKENNHLMDKCSTLIAKINSIREECNDKISMLKKEYEEKIDEVKKDSYIMFDKLRIEYDDKINKRKDYFELEFPLKKIYDIIIPLDEYNLINDWVPEEFKDFKPVLLYKATRDTFTAFAFHSKVNKIENTLFIGTTKSGVKFGGFTSVVFDMSDTWKEDPSKKSFIFSLTKKVKYCLTTKRNAIYDCLTHGPIFGSGSNISICSDSNTNTGSYSLIGYEYALNEKLFDDYSLMMELEVYRI